MQVAGDAEERARLAHLASPAGAAEREELIDAARRSVLDLLLDFPSAARAPPGALLALLPRLRPRPYSIASAPGADGGEEVPPPPPGTKRTRHVPSPVLSGHAASLPPY